MSMLQAQAINQFDAATMPGKDSLRELLEQGHIVVLKGVFCKDLVQRIRRELCLWRDSEPSLDEVHIAENRVLNCFLPLKFKSSEVSRDLDFRANKTGVDAWNFRFGNINDVQLKEKLPDLYESREVLLEAFSKYCPTNPLPHGTDCGRNLYLEFMHFPASTGYIEDHTHESVADFGLEYNMIGVFSDFGSDYQQGGPVFPGPETELRLDRFTESGDVYLFSNRMIHRVEPIRAGSDRSLGRWILTYFWY